jgi:hypothetical protein
MWKHIGEIIFIGEIPVSTNFLEALIVWCFLWLTGWIVVLAGNRIVYHRLILKVQKPVEVPFLNLQEKSIFSSWYFNSVLWPSPFNFQSTACYTVLDLCTYIFWTWNHYWILRTDMIGSPFYQNSTVCTF